MKWSQDKSIRKGFVCVDDVIRALESVHIYILAEGLKIEFFGSLVQAFCESCVHLASIHPHNSDICDARISYFNSCVTIGPGW